MLNSKGYCKFTSCKISFTLTIKDKDLLAELVFFGRVVRAISRKTSASQEEGGIGLIGLGKMKEVVYQYGNRDIAPTTLCSKENNICEQHQQTKRR